MNFSVLLILNTISYLAVTYFFYVKVHNLITDDEENIDSAISSLTSYVKISEMNYDRKLMDIKCCLKKLEKERLKEEIKPKKKGRPKRMSKEKKDKDKKSDS